MKIVESLKTWYRQDFGGLLFVVSVFFVVFLILVVGTILIVVQSKATTFCLEHGYPDAKWANMTTVYCTKADGAVRAATLGWKHD